MVIVQDSTITNFITHCPINWHHMVVVYSNTYYYPNQLGLLGLIMPIDLEYLHVLQTKVSHLDVNAPVYHQWFVITDLFIEKINQLMADRNF